MNIAPLTRPGLSGNVAAFGAGALVTLSLAPFHLWPLSLLSLVILAWLLQALPPRAAAWRGCCYGFGLYGAGTCWVFVSIHVYGYAPLWLASILTVMFCFSAGLLFMTLPCYIYARWIRDNRFGTTLGFTAIYMASEWISSWILTGFPWMLLGYAHVEAPLAGWVPLGGVSAVSFIIALSAAVIADALRQRRLHLPLAALVAALWLAGVGLQRVDWVTPADRPALRISALQANIPQQDKWQATQYWPTLRYYRETSEPLWANNDIVVWPEAAIPALYSRAQGFLDDMHQQALTANRSLITGIPSLAPATTETDSHKVYNSVMAFGTGSGVYYKQKLVPFGEYVPLEDWLRGLIQFFDLPMSNFNRGPAQQLPLQAAAVSLLPLVCFEIIFVDFIAAHHPTADVLLALSNDAWFGRSHGPFQHLQIARMRALENGRQMIRATGSGISALIDHRGRIIERIPQFERAVLSGELQVMTGETPFSRIGSAPVFALSLLLLLVSARRSAAPSPVK